MRRRSLHLLTLASLTACVLAAVVACGGAGGPLTCPLDAQICGSDGKFHCRVLPYKILPLDSACCSPKARLPTGEATADSNDGGSDAGATDAEVADAAAIDGTDAAAPDASATGMAVPGRDAGEACDAGVLSHDGGLPGATDGGFGRDDAGITYIYRCGVDICHPPTVNAPPPTGR